MKKSGRMLIPLAVLLGVVSWFVYTRVKAAAFNHALCLAASEEDTDAVERLLKRGTSPNVTSVT